MYPSLIEVFQDNPLGGTYMQFDEIGIYNQTNQLTTLNNHKLLFGEQVGASTTERMRLNTQGLLLRSGGGFTSVNLSGNNTGKLELSAGEATSESKTTNEDTTTDDPNVAEEQVPQNNQPRLMSQNRPNPFNKRTTIDYQLPESTQRAELMVTNLSGKLIKSYPLTPNIEGQVQIEGGTFATGIYNYSLIIDGQLQETKQMVFTK